MSILTKYVEDAIQRLEILKTEAKELEKDSSMMSSRDVFEYVDRVLSDLYFGLDSEHYNEKRGIK